MVIDNARAHTSISTKQLLKELNIVAVFMPPYSPELNSIERLWGVSKKRFARLLQQAVISDRPINSTDSFDELLRESLVFDSQQIGQLMKTNYSDVLETI